MQGMQPKNYHTEGGNKWVVGGEIEFTPDAKVTGLGADDVNVAWNAITGKPAVIAAGATQQAAREAIGAAAAGGEVSVAWDDVTDKPAVIAAGATAAEARTAIGAGTSSFSGSYNDLTDTPSLGTAAAANTGDFATAAQGALADTAVQPADLPQGAAVEDATDDAVATVNALLASLRAAGLIAT